MFIEHDDGTLEPIDRRKQIRRSAFNDGVVDGLHFLGMFCVIVPAIIVVAIVFAMFGGKHW